MCSDQVAGEMAPRGSEPAAAAGGFEFRVLGPVEVRVDGRPVPLGGTGVRDLLACLLLEPNRVVSVEHLVDALWGESPPPTARTMVQGYVSRIRKLLATGSAPQDRRPKLQTRAPGYQLSVDPRSVDAHRARDLVERAHGLPPAQRAEALSEALALWRGPALFDVTSQLLQRTSVPHLDELKLLALEERVAAHIEIGHDQDLVVELSTLVDQYPLRERFTAQLMLANYRAGHRAEAQARYHALRRRLSDELGIDPGPEVRSLYEKLLRDDASLMPARPQQRGHDGLARPVPAELPPAAPGFVGRERELQVLDRLSGDPGDGATGPLAVVTGTAGVGKSALATTWAHRVAHAFPDGQLYAPLRGFDAERAPLAPAEALTSMLKALGVAADAIPVDLDDRAALYRSLLADRQVLVLLDNARDSDQVRPLLPGATRSVVVVTSRRRLDGLVVRSGARVLPLETLPTETAVQLIDRAGAPSGSASEPAATRQLADLCGGLPLALRIASARLAANPGRRVTDLVHELADERDRLHGLDIDDADTSVRRAFDISYRDLPPPHRVTFRLLGLVPGHTFSVHAVAALCGTDLATARHRLRVLALAHLVTELEPDRYGMHDLLRLYARDQLAAPPPDGSAEDGSGGGGDSDGAALRRLLRFYLVVADQARRHLRPARDELDYSGDRQVHRPVIPDRCAALEWFDLEWPNLVAAVRVANAEGLHGHAWPLVRLQFNYLMVRCPWEDWIRIYSDGLASARELDDSAGKVLMSAGLGVAYSRSGQPGVALAHYAESYRQAVATGDIGWLALTQVNMGSVLFRLRRYAEARVHCREALAAYRQLADRYRQAGALNNLAQVEQANGHLVQALEHLLEAEVMYREADDLETLAMVLNNCGEVSIELGRIADGERYHHEGLQVARNCGSAMRQAAAYLGLGDAAWSRGDEDVARTRWETALTIFETGGSPRAAEARGRLREHLGDAPRE